MKTTEHPKADCRVWPLTCKVSLEESHRIRERAAVQSVPVGRYLRECALNGHIVQTHPVAADQWAALARLAGNLNTLTRHLNQGRMIDQNELAKTLGHLLGLLREVRGSLIA